LSGRKGDGGLAVAGIFSKHSNAHGKVFEGMISCLGNAAAADLLRLSNDSGTSASALLWSLAWKQHPRLCILTVLGLLGTLAWYFMPSSPLFSGHALHSPHIIYDDISASKVCAIEIHYSNLSMVSSGTSPFKLKNDSICTSKEKIHAFPGPCLDLAKFACNLKIAS
jgi:hypothetical protein